MLVIDLKGLLKTHCFVVQLISQFVPDAIPRVGFYFPTMCFLQTSAADSYYFKFSFIRHALSYLAIFYILSYPKPIIDGDSHKSLWFALRKKFLWRKVYLGRIPIRAKVFCGEKKNFFASFSERKKFHLLRNETKLPHWRWVICLSTICAQYLLSACYMLGILLDPEDTGVNITDDNS